MFRLYLIRRITGKYLFGMPITEQIITELDEGKMPEDIRIGFESNNILIPESLIISRTENIWSITYNGSEWDYIIRRKNGELNVYKRSRSNWLGLIWDYLILIIIKPSTICKIPEITEPPSHIGKVLYSRVRFFLRLFLSRKSGTDVYNWIMLFAGLLLFLFGYFKYFYGVIIPTSYLYFAFPRQWDMLGLSVFLISLTYILQKRFTHRLRRHARYHQKWFATQPVTITILTILFIEGILRATIFAVVTGCAHYLASHHHNPNNAIISNGVFNV